MNFKVIIFSVLISVICVLLSLVQFYYLKLKKLTHVKYDPYFTDLIVSPSNNYAINYQIKVLPHEPTPKTKFQATDSEVDKCLKAALAYKVSGKVEKALKLFEHAAVLAPSDPNVLNKFGEFLETQYKDLITADELYFKAVTLYPEHAEALANIKRTSKLVDNLDVALFHLLDEKRDLLKNQFYSSINFHRKREVFYLHIYHTATIEGNTMSINQLRYLLETGKAVGGKSIEEHNAILGLESALRYVKHLSSTKYIRIDDILNIHRRVMGHISPISSGAFRIEQVFVGSYIPPPPEILNKLMYEYVEWLNSEEALSMHPVRLAALAHYKLVEIHPFYDGNGRTSRLLMNLILLKFGYPPVIIFSEDRQKYYELLKIANAGDVRPFVRFIAYCTDETLNTYLGLSSKHLPMNDAKSQRPVIEIDTLQ